MKRRSSLIVNRAVDRLARAIRFAAIDSGAAWPTDASELARLAELASTGRLRTVIAQTFPLAQGRQAFESGAGARRPGKTVLVVR